MSGPGALQAGYILHRRPYRESSLLLEGMTAGEGRFGLIARGARRGGRQRSQAALLQPFIPLWLNWGGRGELALLTGVEARAEQPRLQGRGLLSGFYLNELLLRLLPRHDPHPALFAAYEAALSRLSAPPEEAEWALRRFEVRLLQELGYGLSLRETADDGAPVQPAGGYCYHLEHGPLAMQECGCEGVSVRGETLLALAREEPPGPEIRREAKRLLRTVLNLYLGERPLHSRALFRQTGGMRSHPQAKEQ